MRTLVDNYINFSRTFVENHKEELANNNISILTDFLDNEFYIREFYKEFVEPNTPKIVLCGINPGRKGAGNTVRSGHASARRCRQIWSASYWAAHPAYRRARYKTPGTDSLYSARYGTRHAAWRCG